MASEIPTDKSDKREALDDNARKFIADPIEARMLEELGAKSFNLDVYWLETGEDSERKVVHKQFDDGEVMRLEVTKVRDKETGERVSKKVPIEEPDFVIAKTAAALSLKKRRHEFSFIQDGEEFLTKYDEFEGSDLHMIEIDGSNGVDRMSFDPDRFFVDLTEVTPDRRYEGYRLALLISDLPQGV